MTLGRTQKLLFLVLISQAALSSVFVFFRLADGDEGFYLAAAQRVADGMTLYKDFFYPQAPLLPLLSAMISGWGITSLLLLRILSLVAGLLLTLFAFRTVRESTRDDNAALIAAVLIAANGMILAWHSVFKPYAFVDLFLLLAFMFLLRVENSNDKI